MIARIDRIAAALVALLGLVHLAVGHAVFFEPTNARIWFAAGGFLLITTGLANLAAARAVSRLQSAAAASGSIAMLIIGLLLARGDPKLLVEPQTVALLAIAILHTALRLREIARRPGRGAGAASGS